MTDKQSHMYAISRGMYSDYRVLCICPSKEDADLLAARYKATDDSWGEARVEEFPVADRDTERVEILSMIVTLWDDGSETDEHVSFRVEWPFDSLWGDTAPVQWRWVRAPIHYNRGGRLEVWGTDHDRVRKVFGDRRAMLKTDDAMRMTREAHS